MSILRRVSAEPEPVLADPAVTGCSFPSEYPALFEYLTATVWPDGKQRQTATLMVCVDEGRFRCCLNDRAQGRSAWVSAASLGEALRALDGGLAGDRLEWRRSHWQGKGRR